LRRSRQDHALALNVVGEGLAHRPLALKRTHPLSLFCRLFGSEFIFGRSRLEFFKFQLQLIEQPRRPPRARPIKRATQLLDLKLEMGNQRFSARLLRLGIGRFSKPGFRRKPGRALGQDHRMRGGKIGRQLLGAGVHYQMESYSLLKSNGKLSANARWTPGLLGVAPIDAGQQITHLRLRDRHRAVHQRRPYKTTPLQFLRK